MDDLSLRPIPLPVVLLMGKVTPRPHSRLPSVTLEVSVKQVVIEVTTNVLNQLLILQTAFIKVGLFFKFILIKKMDYSILYPN